MGENFLSTIGLRRISTLEIPMSKQAFASKLQQVTDAGGYGMFEPFSNNGRYLKGTVGMDSFELTRKRGFGNNGGMNSTVYKGTFSQRGENTCVEIETKIRWVVFLFFLFPVLFLAPIYFEHKAGTNLDNFSMLFLLIPFCIIIPIWYFSFKRMVASSEYMIQRELYFLSKKEDASSRIDSHLITGL